MELIVGNRTYSSWSMRSGVLLRWMNVGHRERRLSLSFDPASAFKTEIAKYSNMGTVPILVVPMTDERDTPPVVLGDSYIIMEYLAETFPEKGVWPQDPNLRAIALNMCAQMHAGFSALRSACPMNIGVDQSEVGQIIWRDRDDVRQDVTRIENIWAHALSLSKGPFLCGDFSGVDTYFAPVVIRLKFGLPINTETAAYMEAIFEHEAVKSWIKGALTEDEFLAFDEPYRIDKNANLTQKNETISL